MQLSFLTEGHLKLRLIHSFWLEYDFKCLGNNSEKKVSIVNNVIETKMNNQIIP